MTIGVLFGLVVVGDGVDEGGAEEAGDGEEHDDSVGSEVGVSVHG
jgi:hypothetical protein